MNETIVSPSKPGRDIGPMMLPIMLLLGGGCISFGLIKAGPLLAEFIVLALGGQQAEWLADFVVLLVIFVPLALFGLIGSRWLGAGRVPLGRHLWLSLVGGLVVGAAGAAASFGILASFGAALNGAFANPAAPVALLAGTLIIFIQSLSEEVFFRGWIQNGIARSWGKWPSIIAASMLFVVVHMFNGPLDFVSMLNIFLAGVFFGKLFCFTGGIIAPAMAHFAWNWTETMGLGLSPNPGVSTFGSILDFDLKGASMFGGSVQGMNASFAVGVVLLMLIILLVLARRLRGPAKAEKATNALVAKPAVAEAKTVAKAAGLTLKVQDDSITHVGRVREVNEDSYFSNAELGVWAVADGMGGHEYGERASRAIVESLANLKPIADFEEKVEAVRAAIMVANADIFAEATERGQRMGSTVVALVLVDRQYAVLWAGDSRAYLLRDGAMTRVSRDHTQVQSLIDRGLLAPEDAEGHPMSHVLARAIGVMENVQIDVIRDTVQPNDIFLLCSDGLYGLVSDGEIAERLAPARLSEAADSLIALSLERGAPDNVTAIAVSASEVTLLSFGKDRTDSM